MPVERRAYERSTDPATTARADRPRCNGVGLSIADRQEPRASLSWKSGGLPPYSDADRGRRAARRPERGTVVNVVVWVVQVLLAVAFLGAGAMEVLAALGLILPAVTGVATVLVPLAAVGLALLMALAAVHHQRKGERQEIGINAILFALAVLVAWARFGPYPL